MAEYRPTYRSKTLTNSSDAVKIGAQVKTKAAAAELADMVYYILDKQSAENIVRLDLTGKSSIADTMIVASGRSNRHVSALSDYIQRGLKEIGLKKLGIEGDKQNDWVLIDAGDVIVHLFRPEVREFYALEKLWAVSPNSEDFDDA